MTAREDFERDGYAVFDPAIPSRLLEQAVSDMMPHYVRDEHDRPAWRVLDAWRSSSSVKAIALWPAVLTTLETLTGRRARAFQTLNFPVGTQQAAHSDTIHFDTEPSGLMCGVWIALEDIDLQNGPLVYYPGSHKLPVWSMADAGARLCTDTDMSPYRTYELFVQAQLSARSFPESIATMRRGHAIVWAANLLHGGAPILDPTRTRHSQVTHYFLDGAHAWVSRISGSGKTPSWIE